MNLEIIKPTQPTTQEWQDLLRKNIKNDINRAIVNIIIPVYGAADDSLRCIFSVLNAINNTNFILSVIEDCGPDPDLRNRLKELSESFQFEYFENSQNLGFVLTCNYGFELHPDMDVLLLNSDTEVFDGWLDRIVNCAKSNPKAGTITAMSNNATIFSYPYFCQDYSHAFEIPDKDLDILFSKVNSGQSVAAPTGVGFCMYIRRECLKIIGGFNYEKFGKGYGEENDLCIRAEIAGWQNLVATDVFVRHFGSSSFGNTARHERVKLAINTLNKLHPQYLPSVTQFIENNPMKPYLSLIDLERLNHFISGKDVFLLLTHNLGGGTEKHHQEMAERLSKEGFAVISLKPDNDGDSVTLFLNGQYPLPNLNIPIINSEKLLHFFQYNLNIKKIHIHHLKGFSIEFITTIFNCIKELNIPYYFTIHDYYSICPRITLMDDDLYCGEASFKSCNSCIAGMTETSYFNYDIINWREYYQEILQNAEKVFVPDNDVKWRIERYFPNLKTFTRPHFDTWGTYSIAVSNPNSKRRIGVIGAIGTHKGFEQILYVAQICQEHNLDIEFIIIGYTSNDSAFKDLKNVSITGKYEDADLLKKISESNLDAIWFTSVWPETYSYTLSAALSTNLPIIAFNFGAIGRRLNELNTGILIPIETMLNPKETIKYLFHDLNKYQRKPIAIKNDYFSIISDYY